MIDFERIDPYNEVTVINRFNFELRGDGLAVPIHFKPDTAFIFRTVLQQDSEFTRDVIIDDPGFRELCEGVATISRFPVIFSDLRFMLDSLSSTLIQTAYKRGNSNVYIRNPDYVITDEQVLLG